MEPLRADLGEELLQWLVVLLIVFGPLVRKLFGHARELAGGKGQQAAPPPSFGLLQPAHGERELQPQPVLRKANA